MFLQILNPRMKLLASGSSEITILALSQSRSNSQRAITTNGEFARSIFSFEIRFMFTNLKFWCTVTATVPPPVKELNRDATGLSPLSYHHGLTTAITTVLLSCHKPERNHCIESPQLTTFYFAPRCGEKLRGIEALKSEYRYGTRGHGILPKYNLGQIEVQPRLTLSSVGLWFSIFG